MYSRTPKSSVRVRSRVHSSLLPANLSKGKAQAQTRTLYRCPFNCFNISFSHPIHWSHAGLLPSPLRVSPSLALHTQDPSQCPRCLSQGLLSISRSSRISRCPETTKFAILYVRLPPYLDSNIRTRGYRSYQTSTPLHSFPQLHYLHARLA
jgi:hypothetical protein